jgi:sulfur-oxidizing protein SoxY
MPGTRPGTRPRTRRDFLRGLGLGAASLVAAPLRARAAAPPSVVPPIAVPKDPAAAIKSVIGDAKPAKGKVALDMPYITETGTSVSVAVKVDSPMTEADHVTAIHLFADGNPVPRVASYHLGPRAGRAEVAMRIRLARSQRVIAIAQLSDGSWWSDTREINVAQGACVDDTEGTLGSGSQSPL